MLRRLSTHRKSALFGCAASVLALAATPARAQEDTATAGEEEGSIIVTATKRETSLLEVPFSINAQTEEDIQRAAATTIEDLSRNVAGLTIKISARARARSRCAAYRPARSSATSRA